MEEKLDEALANVNANLTEINRKIDEFQCLNELLQNLAKMVSNLDKKVNNLANIGKANNATVLTEEHLEEFSKGSEVVPHKPNEKKDLEKPKEDNSEREKDNGNVKLNASGQENGEQEKDKHTELDNEEGTESSSPKVKEPTPALTLKPKTEENEKLQYASEKPSPVSSHSQNELKNEIVEEEVGAETLNVKDKLKLFEESMNSSKRARRSELNRAAPVKPQQEVTAVVSPPHMKDNKNLAKSRMHHRSASQPPRRAPREKDSVTPTITSAPATTPKSKAYESPTNNTEPSTETTYRCSDCESVLPNDFLREDGVSIKCVTGGCGHRNIVGKLNEGNKWIFTPCRTENLPSKFHCQQIAVDAPLEKGFVCQICGLPGQNMRDASTWIALKS